MTNRFRVNTDWLETSAPNDPENGPTRSKVRPVYKVYKHVLLVPLSPKFQTVFLYHQPFSESQGI